MGRVPVSDLTRENLDNDSYGSGAECDNRFCPSLDFPPFRKIIDEVASVVREDVAVFDFESSDKVIHNANCF